MYQANLHDGVHGSHTGTGHTKEEAATNAYRQLERSWLHPADAPPSDDPALTYKQIGSHDVWEIWQDTYHDTMLGTVHRLISVDILKDFFVDSYSLRSAKNDIRDLVRDGHTIDAAIDEFLDDPLSLCAKQLGMIDDKWLAEVRSDILAQNDDTDDEEEDDQ